MQCSKTMSEFGCGQPECSIGCIYPAFEHPKSSKTLINKRAGVDSILTSKKLDTILKDITFNSSKLLLERAVIVHQLDGKKVESTRGLEVCKCGSKRRGPMGGVCGNCGQAIPSQQEVEFHKII